MAGVFTPSPTRPTAEPLALAYQKLIRNEVDSMSPRPSGRISRFFQRFLRSSPQPVLQIDTSSNGRTSPGLRNPMARILVADNDPVSQKKIGEILQKGGYLFLEFASNPEEARTILDANLADLAILDLRLTNDKTQVDISGLA